MIIIDCENKKIEGCLKNYRQKIDRIGQNNELRDRRAFEKPSQHKRKKENFAKYKAKKYGNS